MTVVERQFGIFVAISWREQIIIQWNGNELYNYA